MLSGRITGQCRIYFGTKAKRYTDNRCGACPLRAPCLAFGGAPARTFEEIAESRNTFEAAAAELLP